MGPHGYETVISFLYHSRGPVLNVFVLQTGRAAGGVTVLGVYDVG